jgi:hypothetical protein
MPFETVLTNAVPPGEIKAAGTFGPWQAEDPGRTPLDGQFTFDNADLSVFEGISGTLSAGGNFRGMLNRIDVTGHTETPDFTVSTGSHPVPLTTSYHAVVDATNGNTMLDPVDATFLSTSVTAKGGVYEEAGAKGRVVKLDLDQGGRSNMSACSARPPMSGPSTSQSSSSTGQRDIVDNFA